MPPYNSSTRSTSDAYGYGDCWNISITRITRSHGIGRENSKGQASQNEGCPSERIAENFPQSVPRPVRIGTRISTFTPALARRTRFRGYTPPSIPPREIDLLSVQRRRA